MSNTSYNTMFDDLDEWVDFSNIHFITQEYHEVISNTSIIKKILSKY